MESLVFKKLIGLFGFSLLMLLVMASSCNDDPPATNTDLDFTFSALPEEGEAPLKVSFRLGGTGFGVRSCSLDTGDGATINMAGEDNSCSSKTVDHTYTNSGEYKAVLTVNAATDPRTRTETIIVREKGTPMLTAVLDGEGDGEISSAPTGIFCPGDCEQYYDVGTTVTLTAEPDADSVFTAWSNCDTTQDNICTVTIANSKTVTATFTPKSDVETRKLTVKKQGDGQGEISSKPAGISCFAEQTECSDEFAKGAMVTLTPNAVLGSTFTGWLTCPAVFASDCVVEMLNDEEVVAQFTKVPIHKLTVSLDSSDGKGKGRVSSSDIRIICGTDCTGDYSEGDTVSLTATPDEGSEFVTWTGDCSGTTPACSVLMTSAKSATAVFKEKGTTPLSCSSITGTFMLTPMNIVTTDPGGHGCCVGEPLANDLTFSFSEGSFNVTGPVPFIDVTGDGLTDGNANSCNFSATGKGSAAGFLDVDVLLSGEFNPTTNMLMARYSMGTEGEFPGGDPYIQDFDGTLSDPE